jgi:hypothetical protein
MVAARGGMTQMTGAISEPMMGMRTMRRASRSLRLIRYMVAPSMLLLLAICIQVRARIQGMRAMGRANSVQCAGDSGTFTWAISPEMPPIWGRRRVR